MPENKLTPASRHRSSHERDAGAVHAIIRPTRANLVLQQAECAVPERSRQVVPVANLFADLSYLLVFALLIDSPTVIASQ